MTERAFDRREFIFRAGTGAGIAAIAYQGLASLRSLVPNVSYDAPTTVKLGLVGEFPDGLKFLPDERLFVFREGNTFHAISAVCTHLGCTARAEALPSPEYFEPWHGHWNRCVSRSDCPPTCFTSGFGSASARAVQPRWVQTAEIA